jgi:hypothetical protein
MGRAETPPMEHVTRTGQQAGGVVKLLAACECGHVILPHYAAMWARHGNPNHPPNVSVRKPHPFSLFLRKAAGGLWRRDSSPRAGLQKSMFIA